MTSLLLVHDWHDELLDYYQARGFDCVILALSASVQARLKKLNVPFETTIKYFTKDSHQLLLKTSKKIVGRLRDSFSLSDELGVHESYERTFFFYFRFHLHYVLQHLEILQNACQKTPFNEMVLFADRNDNVTCSNVELLVDLCSGFARHYQKNFLKVITNKKENRTGIKTLSRLIKEHLFPLFLNHYKRRFNKYSTFLLLSSANNFARLSEKIEEKGQGNKSIFLSYKNKHRTRELLTGKIFYFPDVLKRQSKKNKETFKEQLSQCVNRMECAVLDKEMVSFHGINLQSLLERILKESLSSKLIELNQRVSAINEVLEAHKPKACFAQHALAEGHALGELSQQKKIPALLITHGSHVSHQQETADIEWQEHARTLVNANFSYVAVQTPLCQKFLRDSEDLQSQIVLSGPIIFAGKSTLSEEREALRKRLYKEHSKKKIILHAGTPKDESSIRPWVYETVDEYIRNINDLIEVTSRIENTHLAIRFRALPGLTEEDLKTLLNPGSHYLVYSTGSFDEYLLSSDLLVSYSSTTIEEALCNQVPVLQYDPDDKYCHVKELPFANSKERLKELLTQDLTEKCKPMWQQYQNFHEQAEDWLDAML